MKALNSHHRQTPTKSHQDPLLSSLKAPAQEISPASIVRPIVELGNLGIIEALTGADTNKKQALTSSLTKLSAIRLNKAFKKLCERALVILGEEDTGSTSLTASARREGTLVEVTSQILIMAQTLKSSRA